MKSKNLSPLFIGFGLQAIKYAEVFKHLGIKISSVCVSDLKKNQNKLDSYNIKYRYSSIPKAIKDNKYNCIFVFLPWNMIEKKIIYIIKNTKKNIYTEKPVALSLSKLEKISLISKKCNKGVYVLYNRRFYKIFSVIKKKLQNKNFYFKAHIPEKLDLTLKERDKNLKGYIKYHLSSHWFDFFMQLTGKNIIDFFIKKEIYNFILDDNKNYKKKITLKYNDTGRITSQFTIGNDIYKLKTLEQLKVYSKTNYKLKDTINEFKINKFKPGVYNLVKKIIKNDRKNIPKLNELINLYKVLEKLPY